MEFGATSDGMEANDPEKGQSAPAKAGPADESIGLVPHGNGMASAKDGNANILGQARNLLLISQLLDMGFDVKASKEALQATGGSSAEKAADWLLGGSANPKPGGGQEPTKQTTVNQFFVPPTRKRAVSEQPEDKQVRSSLWARRGPEAEGRPAKLQRIEPPPAKLAPPGGAAQPAKKQVKFTPLAERMRPQTLDDLVGQEQLVGPGTMLRSLILSNAVPSMILWGPPGSGKTTLARVIAKMVSSRFVQLSAVTAGVKELREVLEQARNGRRLGHRTLLFVDETHRFNKSQQDAFLPAVEEGDVTLIGATTENPSFELNAALLSRCRVFTLNKLQPQHIKQVLQRALSDEARGLLSPEALHRPSETGPQEGQNGDTAARGTGFEVEDEALEFLAGAADGDARTALNALEMAAGAALERSGQPGGEQGASERQEVRQKGGSGSPGQAEGSPSGRGGLGISLPGKVAASLANDGAFGSPVEGTGTDWQKWAAKKDSPRKDSPTKDSPPGGRGRQPGRKSSLGEEGDAKSAEKASEVAEKVSEPEVKTEGAGDGRALITLADISAALQRSHVGYDKTGEEHYNVISALHKSMRGGDADAALYWLARMLRGGEGPLYVARRLVRFASEDVGLADPSALPQAVATYQACHFIGMPECDVCLAQCVAYLALAPKSVACYRAVQAAQDAVMETGQNEPVPLHLRNAPTKLMKQLGYGKGYVYPPGQSEPVDQEYMPPSLVGRKFLDWPPGGGS